MGAAREAYEAGRWQEAAAHAQTTGGAEGYAFAAGALIAQLMVEPDMAGREAQAQRAEDLAAYAYQLDEESVSAQINLAASLGYRGRFMQSWRAFVARLPQRGRNLLEDAVSAQPDNAWALGLLGAWHLEVARRGGRRGMGMLDASVEAGMGYYSQAIAYAPQDPAPRLFYALGLAALDEPAYFDEVTRQIQIVLALPPRNALDEGVIAEARAFAAQLGDRRLATQWAQARMAM